MSNKPFLPLLLKKTLPYILIAPLLACACFLILVPAAGTFVSSLFRDVTFLGKKFIFLENYFSVMKTAGFLQSFKFTALFVMVSVPLELAAGILLAALLNESMPGRGFLRVAVLIPWAIPVAVSGRVWQLIFNFSYGAINTFLIKTGMISSPVNWLGSEASAFFALVLADAWKTVPFTALIILAGMQSIPGEIYEQSKTDGANMLQRFFLLTLPVIKPVILVALLFRTIDALRVFDIIFVLTGGGPGGSTSSLSMRAYEYFLAGDFGGGSAVSVVLFFMALILSAFYLKAGGFSEGLK